MLSDSYNTTVFIIADRLPNVGVFLSAQAPEEVTLWLDHSEAALILRKCGYWYSLYGAAETSNTTSITVAIPRKRQFTVEALVGIMERLRRGELP